MPETESPAVLSFKSYFKQMFGYVRSAAPVIGVVEGVVADATAEENFETAVKSSPNTYIHTNTVIVENRYNSALINWIIMVVLAFIFASVREELGGFWMKLFLVFFPTAYIYYGVTDYIVDWLAGDSKRQLSEVAAQ